MSSTDGTDQDPSSLWKLVHLDPIMLNLIVTAITGVAALFGVVVAEEKAKLIAVAIFLVVVAGMQIWARAKTLSKKKVLAFVPDPTGAPATVCPGQATTTASDIRVLAAVSTPGRQ